MCAANLGIRNNELQLLEEARQFQERLNRGLILIFSLIALLLGTLSVVFAILSWEEAKTGTAKTDSASQFDLFQFCKNLVS